MIRSAQANVETLARPGGNVTGLSLQASDLVGKRLELLREIVPILHRLAILGDVGNRGAKLEMNDVQAMAHSLGIEVKVPEIRRPDDIALAFKAIKGQVDALYACTDGLVNTNHSRISTYALADRLPTIGNQREYAVAGGLVSYGPNVPEMFRRAADYVDKILRGAKPGDIPVEQPTKFDLVINLTTAKAIGLTVPPSLLARADELIE
jgi:putative ABC transport system substrate-binding protein